MSDTESIKKQARERAVASKLPYAGALTPGEAHTLMQAGAKLVDVRTRAELYWVGKVPGSLAVEWNSFPEGALNPDFVGQVAQVANKDDPIMFLCRSGARSHSAAALATKAGYAECYNILEGFEGDKDARGQRNLVNGWRKAGLPWTQS